MTTSTTPIKHVISDLDGTLLRFGMHNESQASFSKEVLRAVGELASKGIGLSIASGRSWSLSQEVVRPLALTGFSIFDAGATIIDTSTGTVIWERRLNDRELGTIFQITSAFVSSIILDGRDTENLKWSGNLRPHVAFIRATKAHIATMSRQLTATGLLSVQTDPNAGLSNTNSSLLVTAKGVDKGSAVVRLASYINVDLDDVLAIGDSPADVPMFEVVGRSVSMGNAPAAVRRAADRTTASVADDGFAIAVRATTTDEYYSSVAA